MEQLIALIKNNNFTHYAFAGTEIFVPLDDIRSMCQSNRCDNYGKNWSCPPACGTIKEIREKFNQYKRGLIVQTTSDLEDEFDYPGMQTALRKHKLNFSDFARQVKLIVPKSLFLSAGPCNLCVKCTYPERNCRFPSKMLSPMEAYGLWVSDICSRAGLSYNYGKKTITYTSCVLFTKE